LRVVLSNHPEVTHYWNGDQLFSVEQLLAGRCPEARPDMAAESHVDATGRLHINRVGRPSEKRLFGILSQAMLSDFEVDPDGSGCSDCVATIAIAADILMTDADSVRHLIETGQLSSHVNASGFTVVPVRELEEIVPEWWNMDRPNRA
jgi:hypothetical protein